VQGSNLPHPDYKSGGENWKFWPFPEAGTGLLSIRFLNNQVDNLSKNTNGPEFSEPL